MQKHEIPYKSFTTGTEQKTKRKGLFSFAPSPFYRVCMGFRASVSVTSVN